MPYCDSGGAKLPEGLSGSGAPRRQRLVEMETPDSPIRGQAYRQRVTPLPYDDPVASFDLIASCSDGTHRHACAWGGGDGVAR